MMSKNKIPDKNEWDKILSDAFLSQEHHTFSEKYNAQKAQIQKGIIMKRKKTNPKKRMTAVIASAAALVVLIPGGVYAYNSMTAEISKTAPYRSTIHVQKSTDSENSAESSSSAEIQDDEYMNYKLDYIPEGYVLDEPGFKYHNEETSGGISPFFYSIPKTDDFKVDLLNSAECENYESQGKTAMISYMASYNNGEAFNFGREIWIFFNDTRYFLRVCITDDISPEDMYKIIDNASLYPVDEKCCEEYIPRTEEPESDSADKEYPVDIDKANIIQIGEEGCNYDKYTVTINNAEITDSFEGITTDGCGWDADFSDLMDENGNIIENIRTWMKIGDRVNTIDEEVSKESVPYHILKINATFTNITDEEENIGISPELLSFDENNKPVLFETVQNIPEGFNADEVYWEDSIGLDAYFSMYADPEYKGSKNSIILAPGESTDVDIRFMCSKNRIGNSYISFYMEGNSWSKAVEDGMALFDVTELEP